MAAKDFEKCQIATPFKYVDLMLDIVEYKKNIFGRKVLENSCGEGNILCKVVERYILDGFSLKKNREEIALSLQGNIYGVEYDNNKKNKCIENLNNLILKYKINNVKWNISNEDFLQQNNDTLFSYIIGNPPYISYKNLSIANRTYCKEKFISCEKGKFDYCYAFIEKSLQLLNDNGKFVYLVPNSIFKNVFAEKLRDLLKTNIKSIYDNFNEKVFQEASVSPSIFLYINNSSDKYIDYYDCFEGLPKNCMRLLKEKLDRKWIFSTHLKQDYSDEYLRFGDAFIVGNSIATLSNKCFLVKANNLIEKKNYYKADNESKLEKTIVKDAVSPSSIKNNIKYKIIFPYYYLEDKLCRYSEKDFKAKYPNAFKYLKNKKEVLEKRTSDEKTLWFEYGRSQALKNMNENKLMISILINEKINVYSVSKDTIPFSGIYITSKTSEYPLSLAKKILESPQFFDYIYAKGIKSEGNSRRITCNDVKDYCFKMQQ